MYKGKRILAMIPARGGSKGIKGKNIKFLCGKPLLAYSIEVALQCSYIDYVLVSTDSEEIAKCGKDYGAKVPFLRPAEYATDEAKTIDVLLHGIETLKQIGEEFDYLMLLQPTQPFRTPQQLSEVIEMVIDKKLASLVSVCPVEEHPILMRTLGEEGELKSILSCRSTVRRQDFPPVYKVNGSIYMNRIDEKFNKNTSLNDNQYPYFMTREDSIDIDTIEDFYVAEQKIKKMRGNKEDE
ncbi:MAG: acylneuraminate cytidylyltransferase family protein [Lachnospiraceae bacterium]|nr:acylneuraminate cytidylyltransferase family protein [Lachnospiraceae bacterium]